MLLTESVEVMFNGKNAKYYEEKGYEIPRYWDKKHKKMSIKQGTKINVKVEDLAKGSHVRVNVACDYCGQVKNVAYKDYLYNHNELGDCCVKCRSVKYKDTMIKKYGAISPTKVPELLEKQIANNKAKYGCEWPTQTEEVKAKIQKTMLERYGAEHALQVDEFLAKAMESCCEAHKNPTSKPQLKLSEILLEMYGNCELEYPCKFYSLDCMIIVNDVRIDVEYDGWFWHQDKKRDDRRDNFIKKHGYKVLRIKSNKHDALPTKERIDEKVQLLLNGEDYAEIQM